VGKRRSCLTISLAKQRPSTLAAAHAGRGRDCQGHLAVVAQVKGGPEARDGVALLLHCAWGAARRVSAAAPRGSSAAPREQAHAGRGMQGRSRALLRRSKLFVRLTAFMQ